MSRCFLIAEVGSVHDGSLGNAKQLIAMAARCGVDAVKFQTHIAEAETLRDAPMPPFFEGEPRFEYFKRTAFSESQWKELKEHCNANNVEFLSSPFSIEAIELLERVGVARYKIPSGEITNLPMLELVAQTRKPILISSGMSSWQELDCAVNTILRFNDQLTVMQCTTEYPCAYENVGLNVMLEMKERYHLPTGFSDHTLTNYASFAAVTLGASAIERHVAFSRQMYGSDAKHSLEPNELTDFVSGVRAIETMMATRVSKDSADRFDEMKKVFEKSLVALKNIPAGTTITREMIGERKPGTGISPTRFNEVIGRRAKRDIKEWTLLSVNDIESDLH